MTINDDTYARAKALAAAIDLIKLKWDAETLGRVQFRELTESNELIEVAKRFEDYIRDGV